MQHWPDASFSPVNIDSYNRRLDREIAQVRDFVILHYHATLRDDSELWRRVATMPIPDTLAERVEAFRDRGILYPVAADEYFQPTSWLAVMAGQGLTPRAPNPLYAYQDMARTAVQFDGLKAAFAEAAARLPTHEDFLKSQRMWA